ncbi:hypothetical protein BU23DRAFT_601238, partial [Bimuria novae-zelandiae CBS 107.79]
RCDGVAQFTLYHDQFTCAAASNSQTGTVSRPKSIYTYLYTSSQLLLLKQDVRLTNHHLRSHHLRLLRYRRPSLCLEIRRRSAGAKIPRSTRGASSPSTRRWKPEWGGGTAAGVSVGRGGAAGFASVVCEVRGWCGGRGKAAVVSGGCWWGCV